jgi:Fe-Mn family superoxide dismutase
MAITLPPLPYRRDALEPHISAQTLEFHYDKHHRGYVEKTNKLIEETRLASKSLIDIIVETADVEKQKSVFNNAAQAWNHEFYWNSMKPGGAAPPSGLARAIDRDFDGIEAFKEAFARAGAEQFGSGWAWLVLNGDGKLEIRTTPDAETPLTDPDATPLLAMDVWEHAYYLDRQNRREDYIQAFLQVINWEFVDANLERAGETVATKVADRGIRTPRL